MQSILQHPSLGYIAVEGQLSDLLFQEGWKMLESKQHLPLSLREFYNCTILRKPEEIYDEEGQFIEEALDSIEQLASEEEDEEETTFIASFFDSFEQEAA